MGNFHVIGNTEQLKHAQQWLAKLFNEHGWVKVTPSTKKRKLSKNALSHVWYKEISDQRRDNTEENYRNYCKLHFGVPILRRDCEEFKEIYDEVIKPMPYETKLKNMFFVQVKSLMSENQMTEYLHQVEYHFAEQGVMLSSLSEASGV